MRRWSLASGAAVLAVLVAAGCGGSDKSDATADAGSGGEAGTAAEEAGGASSGVGAGSADGAGADGKPDEAAAVAPDVMACELVTAAEVAAAIGQPAEEGQQLDELCHWETGEFGVTIGVRNTAGSTVMTAEEAVDAERQAIGEEAVEIAGLGDEAVSDGNGILGYRTGDWFVTISLYGNQAAAESLGQLIAGRL